METVFTAEQLSELSNIIGDLIGKPLPEAAKKDAATYLYALRILIGGSSTAQPYAKPVQDAFAQADLRNNQRRTIRQANLNAARARGSQTGSKRSFAQVSASLASRGINAAQVIPDLR